MSYAFFNLTVLIMVCAAAAGCDPSAMTKRSGSGNDKTNSSFPRPSARTELLKKLQNQSKQQEQATLLAIVQHDDAKTIRYEALEYLSVMGSDASSLGIPLAEQLLVESDYSLVRKLQSTLVEIDADIEEFLVGAAKTANEEQMSRIVETLGDVSANKPKSLEFLTERLSVQDRLEQQAACDSLAKIGPAAQLALPKLIEIAARPQVPLKGDQDGGLAHRESRDLHRAALSAIAAIGASEQSIPVLTTALSGDPFSAQIAADALATLGPRAASALPELEKLKARNDYQGRAIAIAMAVKAAKQAIAAIKPVGN